MPLHVAVTVTGDALPEHVAENVFVKLPAGRESVEPDTLDPAKVHVTPPVAPNVNATENPVGAVGSVRVSVESAAPETEIPPAAEPVIVIALA